MHATHPPDIQRLGDPGTFLSMLLQGMPFPLLVFTLDGSFFYGNQAVQRQLGLMPEFGYNLLADPMLNDESVRAAFRAAREGTVIETPMHWALPYPRRVREDGSPIVLAVASKFFCLREQTGAIAYVALTIIDCTSDMQRKEALETERDLLRFVFEESGEGLIVTDPQGKVLMANPEAQRQSGLSFDPDGPGDWLDSFDLCCEVEACRPRPPPLARALAGTPVKAESWSLRRSDETLRQVVCSASPLQQADGRLAGAVLMTRDETERFQREAELRRAWNHAEATQAREHQIAQQRDLIFDAMVEAVLIIDSTGSLVLINEAARKMLGYDGDDLNSLVSLVRARRIGDKEVLKTWDSPLARALAGETVRELPLAIHPPHLPEEIIIEVSAAPVRNAAGKIVGAISIGLDITDRFRTARYRDQVIHILGHDVRNPLAAARLAAFDLSHKESLSDSQRSSLEVLRRSLERVERIISDLTTYTRVRLGEGLPVQLSIQNIQALCAQIMHEIKTVYPERILELRSEGPLQARVDPDRFAQVLANLLSNAAQHGLPGSCIQVILEPRDEGFLLKVQNRPQGRTRSTRAEPPSSSSQVAESTGLGLFIVHEVMQTHGGWARMESTPELVTVTTYWPARGRSAPTGHVLGEASPVPGAPARAPGSKL